VTELLLEDCRRPARTRIANQHHEPATPLDIPRHRLPLLLAAGLSEAAAADSELRREFADPPLRWLSRPLWFWNGKLDAEKTRGMVADCKAAGYCGMGILPCKGMGVDFMSPEFLKHSKVAVDEAGRLGMKMCLYDEFWFPSGSAGGLLAKEHPEALSKRLDMLAADVAGPKQFTQAVPEGTLMGAVAMAAATHQRLDITASIKDGALRWNVPADQFAKGINVMVPHAVWFHPASIVFQPDLSPGAPKYGPALPAYNQYIGRLQRMLQGGRHVADIGVLYPIATLQAGSWFGPGNPYEGCVDVPEADYMQLGEALSLGVRRDFTFVHPEVLEERCAVDGATMTLNNKVNHERWRAFIIPGSRCINVATLRRIKQFYDQGGTVIATTRLPDRAAEFGADAEVRHLVAEIFGPDVSVQDAAPRVSASSTWAEREPSACHRNAKGGKAWFLPSPGVAALKAVLTEALPDGDVVIEQDRTLRGGNVSYIHKVKDGQSMYFIANSSDVEMDTWIALRGKLTLEIWNPHDGKIGPVEVEHVIGKEGPVTRVHVRLAPVRSLFLVAADMESMK